MIAATPLERRTLMNMTDRQLRTATNNAALYGPLDTDEQQRVACILIDEEDRRMALRIEAEIRALLDKAGA